MVSPWLKFEREFYNEKLLPCFRFIVLKLLWSKYFVWLFSLHEICWRKRPFYLHNSKYMLVDLPITMFKIKHVFFVVNEFLVNICSTHWKKVFPYFLRFSKIISLYSFSYKKSFLINVNFCFLSQFLFLKNSKEKQQKAKVESEKQFPVIE